MEEEAGAVKGKERRVTFRMERGDYDALCERCERAGLSKSEYLRYLVRIPLSTEANAGDEHRILVDRKALWAMSRELTKWGYHYNQAVHAMNLINFHARHGHVDRDLVAESVPTIERELADVNAAAREMAAELGRIGADSLVGGLAMPILKPISGHGSTGGIRRYLEKGGRALARDLFNLSYDERDAGALGEDAKEACAWDAEMDATRAAFGTDAPWRGKPARTFKHFVLSPDPGDDIDLAALRELACSWALKHFGDHEIAIVYHDDNARGIPHAHIVVNNANLRTGYRMQTQHPEDLNRDLQDMARERGLSGLSNDRAPESPSKARGHAGAGGPRSRRSVYLGRAEKEIMRSGGYSWVGDIRARVALAKTTARDEAEFLGILDALGVHVADNSAKARRDDWVFSLAEEPSKKVSGERLGFVYGKEMLRRRFERKGAYRPTDASTARIREAAERALELNDLSELSRLSSALETCAKFDVESIEEFGLRMTTLERRGQAGGEGYRRLEAARAYMAENGLMPLKTRYGDGEGRDDASGNSRQCHRADEQQRILAAERQRAQQDQRRERGRR